MMKGLETWNCSAWRRKGSEDDLVNVSKHLKGEGEEDGARCFSVVSSDRSKDNGHKSKHRRISLNIRRHFFSVKRPNTGTSCLEKLQGLHSWRYSKPI